MCYTTTMPIPSRLPHHSSGSLCLEQYLQHPAATKMVDEINPHVGVQKPFKLASNVPTHTIIVGIQLIFPATTDIKLGQPPSNNDKGKVQVDKEDAEEEEESDDSDLEGDNENTDDEDGSTENSEEEDEEDDEAEDNSDEEEDEEEDEDEEGEEYDNHYSDDDFGQDTYGDDGDGLVIEFEESPEVEEEEGDGADVGKGKGGEKGGEKTPAPATPRDSVPFWFSHEEPEQLRLIFDSYSTTLELEEQRKQCIRAPAPFIGRIKRTQVEEEPFTTLDEVEIYLREIYPLGTMLPLSRTDWVLTSWDPEEGVPTKIVKLTKQMRKFWKKRTHGHSSSYLYCSPLFRTKEEYTYNVSPQNHDVMYTSDSATYTSVTQFSPFLPERCREVTFSRD